MVSIDRILLITSLIVVVVQYDIHKVNADTIDNSVFTSAMGSAGFNDAVFYGVTDNCMIFLTHTVKGLHDVFSKHIDRACTKTNTRVYLRRKYADFYQIVSTTVDGYIHLQPIKLPLEKRDEPVVYYIDYHKDAKFSFNLIETIYDEANNQMILIESNDMNLDNDYKAESFAWTDRDPPNKTSSHTITRHNSFSLTNFYEIWRLFGDTMVGGYIYAHGQSSIPSPVYAFDADDIREAKPIQIPWEAESEFDHVQDFAAFGALWVFLSIEKAETLRVTIANGETFDNHGVALECTECEFNGFLGVRGVVQWGQDPPSKKFPLKYADRTEEESSASRNTMSIVTFIAIAVARQY